MFSKSTLSLLAYCFVISNSLLPSIAIAVDREVVAGLESEEESADQRVKIADSYRFSMDSNRTITEVIEYEKGGKIGKQQLYEVLTKPGKGSLALFKSSSQEGQKVLMQDEKFWIFMPKTRRPIRISPMQKLMGDASVGDLTTVSWVENYSANIDITSPIQDTDSNEIKIILTANKKGLSYEKTALYLDRETNFPIRGEFYLKSGKLAKKATFVEGSMNGKPWVIEMILENSLLEDSRTVMKIQSSVNEEIADKIFNPSFLVRNNI